MCTLRSQDNQKLEFSCYFECKSCQTAFLNSSVRLQYFTKHTNWLKCYHFLSILLVTWDFSCHETFVKSGFLIHSFFFESASPSSPLFCDTFPPFLDDQAKTQTIPPLAFFGNLMCWQQFSPSFLWHLSPIWWFSDCHFHIYAPKAPACFVLSNRKVGQNWMNLSQQLSSVNCSFLLHISFFPCNFLY